MSQVPEINPVDNPVDTGKWVHNISRTPEEVELEYNAISAFYEQTVQNKGYEAPIEVAKRLANFVSPDTPVLDVGCGTGLVGEALSRLGFSNIVGIDIATKTLEIADQKGVYTKTLRANILEPLEFEDQTFGAITCVAVFSRFDDETIFLLLKEFARILKSSGLIVFTHREDLVKTSRLQELIAAEPSLILEFQTEAQPYLPGDENYQGIGVHYFGLRVDHKQKVLS